jgi:hypothetical protein
MAVSMAGVSPLRGLIASVIFSMEEDENLSTNVIQNGGLICKTKEMKSQK